ncbi:lipid II:glycine glycyltransferase FemX [Arthrobacter sp. UM1]|uniref:lipid II:glycine glycyltransferase FemX n=1 Tax=Arthrobacter sp. UM1 TaxID=2766776 RepID=UPI001CF6104A|nr:peptidoglycan bridge formation glycyltransferase FemA/FemB family protein [Arthrobacter sp. UM1]MCB4208665.1 peptidoglycan bridge formation glycyltransferase FemA/FemB family protein [Arthrobacter sp. UM1]
MPQHTVTIKKLSLTEYEAVLDAQPAELYIPFEQSAAWTRIDADNPARQHYGFFAFYEGDTLVAFCSVYRFIRRIRESLVVLAGPTYTSEPSAELERSTVEALQHYVASDPAVNILYLRMHLHHPESIKGAQLSIERGMFEREVVVDVAGKSPDELKKSFSSNAKTRINRAARAGVEIREVTENRGQVFEESCFPIMQETADRDAFSLMPLEVYRSCLEDAPENTRLFIAYAPATDDPGDAENKIPVGWMMTNEFHYRGCYYYGGSNLRAQETSAMFALMHRILSELAATGNLAVGLTGISSERYPELKGVENFKLRFSKQIVDYPRLYDVPLNAARYTAVRTVLKARSEGPDMARQALGRVRSAASGLLGTVKSAASRSGAGSDSSGAAGSASRTEAPASGSERNG